MKILMVNKFLYPNGGSETYMFQLGEQLSKSSHQVEYFGMQDDRNVVGNAANSYTENMDFHGSMTKKILYPIKIIYSHEARKKIRKVLREFAPDVVHINNFNFQLTPSIICEIRKYHIPIIYTAHDCQLVCPNHLCMNQMTGKTCEKCLEKSTWQCTKYKCIHGSRMKSFLGTVESVFYRMLKTYRMIDVILCPSHFMKKMLDTNKDLANCTMVMRNFVNFEQGTESDKMQKTDERYALYFGRYSAEKGVETLLKACKEVPEIQFKFAGKGELKSQILLASNITEFGFVTGNVLEELVRNAAFSICPSECYENCPFSVMESIMYGTPVIGSRVGGIPELIQDGTDGLLFTSGDVGDLVDKIKQLWYNTSTCDEFSDNCKSVNFDTLEMYTEKLLKVYQNEIERYT